MTGDAGTPEMPSTSSDLLHRLRRYFPRWSPRPPVVVSRGSREVVLVYSAGVCSRVPGLLYTVQRKEKIPPWVTVYSGGKTEVTIKNLAPGHPHRFRLKIIIRASALDKMAAMEPGDDDDVLDAIESIVKEVGGVEESKENRSPSHQPWLESRWSEEVWASTDSEGTSAACFCMAVRCGYLVQVQQMLEARPELVGVVNSSSGLTPLATAARRGDTSMVRQLLASGAEVDQRSAHGRTALHVATLHHHLDTAHLLLASGADYTLRDVNGMRIEHFAVDSGALDALRLAAGRGDIRVKDNNGWTPLFRAVVHGASSEMVAELLARGSEVDVTDRRGLTLTAAARLLRGRLGANRDSILKLVDSQYQHEKALANFTRITKKISSIHSLLARK
ncbi:serine/threonine-protein phosphatase 6 regulatory ankyrin repeat subunit A [Aricia agestis]|uniref:serine/threonine-protein phosphatase 6 regulatory ankyrin repeat subunit A n=1 Tax=Aricia agestis TaxID=91739 RepID=UPI001C2097BF|nr:serine/threonine-protein phosphatase 6 regulatory ankyrin repeat subunit A [Aricia agestis]